MVLLLFIGPTAGFVGTGSALFTSTATVSANGFSEGTVEITSSPNTAAVTFSNMAPGDQTTAPILVTNAGTLAMRYAVTSVATNSDSKGLMSQLVLTVKSAVTVCTSGTGFAADGIVLYTGPFGSLSPGINVVGNPGTGFQTGDRQLAAGAGETLCFNVSLPRSATAQGAATTATLTFASEQTANN
jgi:hypothetical protein